MSAPAQPYLFSQIGLDSGALTMLGAIVHRFPEPGEYRGVVTGSDGEGSVFHLSVEKGRAAAQVNVDLAAVAARVSPSPCHCGTDHGGEPHYVAGTGSPVLFHVSGGRGGYAVHVSRSEERPQPKAFDSRVLRDGDLFAATILRPGLYAVVNRADEQGAARGSIEVVYPPIGKAPHRPPGPVGIRCTGRGFEPSTVRLSAMQGCLFTCERPARIRIELEKPFEPPEGPSPSA